MADNPHPFTGHFLQGRLRKELELRELDVLEQLVDRTAVLQNESKILRNGKPSEHVTILIEGLAIQSKCDSERRSHIVGFHVPGDFVDLEAFILNQLDHDSVACGQVKVGFVPQERLRKVIRDEPHLAQLLWLSTVLNASINRQWIMKSRQLSAIGRMAHFFADLWYRIRMVGMGHSNGFQTMLTHRHLASICGISTVHVSRTLRDLREGGVLDFQRGRFIILDRDKLKVAARFDKGYLYRESGPAVDCVVKIHGSASQPASDRKCHERTLPS